MDNVSGWTDYKSEWKLSSSKVACEQATQLYEVKDAQQDIKTRFSERIVHGAQEVTHHSLSRPSRKRMRRGKAKW